MPSQPVIIDCDPGHDDAINLLVAMAPPDELDILAVTAVAGNAPLDMTERNARMICDIAGRTDVAVFRGCQRPLKRELTTALPGHGVTGLDGLEFVEPTPRTSCFAAAAPSPRSGSTRPIKSSRPGSSASACAGSGMPPGGQRAPRSISCGGTPATGTGSRECRSTT